MSDHRTFGSPTGEPLIFWGGVRYADRLEGPLELDVLAPPSEGALRPVVVYFHGGGWHEGDRGAAMHPWLSPLVARRGFVAVSVGYRLSGAAAWPAQLRDAEDAVAWVRVHARELGGDPDRVGVWGFSAGAHLAAFVALDPASRVRAAALAACPADLRAVAVDGDNEVTRLAGGRPDPAKLAELSPVCRVVGAGPPLLMVHGVDDEVVPVAQGEALRDAVRSHGGEVEWHPIPGGRHDWADKPAAPGSGGTTFGSLAADFFERRLLTGPRARESAPVLTSAPARASAERV